MATVGTTQSKHYQLYPDIENYPGDEEEIRNFLFRALFHAWDELTQDVMARLSRSMLRQSSRRKAGTLNIRQLPINHVYFLNYCANVGICKM